MCWFVSSLGFVATSFSEYLDKKSSNDCKKTSNGDNFWHKVQIENEVCSERGMTYLYFVHWFVSSLGFVATSFSEY